MEKFTSKTTGVLKHISTVVVTLKKFNFQPEYNKDFKKALSFLNKYLETDEVQTVLFCSIFTAYFDYLERPFTLMQISDYYECNPLNVLQYKDKMQELLEKGLIEETDAPDGMNGKPFYKIPNYVTDAILAGDKISTVSGKNVKSIQTFIRQTERLGDRRVDSSERIDTLFRAIENLERSHKDVKAIEQLKKIIPRIEDRVILYDTTAGMINHMNSEVDLMVLINRVTDEGPARMQLAESIMNETNILFKNELMQFENKSTMMESTISLTDKSLHLLLGDEGKFYEKKLGEKQLKSHEKIQQKELFYMEENEKEISKLFASLKQDNFVKLQTRLEERKMPVGICVMFYGEPGTGKTETVYQLAKSTNRNIFHVDIGSVRSQWYGETEQKMKKIFSDYKKLCESAKKNNDNMPILLFNEADALFGKRREISGPGEGSRTDNTIQNILLEEMETLPGILIATTNLEENFDKAFERRFLFKVKFKSPNASVKAKIWKSNLAWLTEEQAQTLAKNYSFTGGEILNIVRKTTMDEILTGNLPSFKEVLDYCKNEKIKSGAEPIGFERKI
ncbi:ATP-binding protein [Treponema zioleckii]|uniref:ATP-binding protein n=1 Tax=Treponema zioleckii TaxID=331680 RepID=UPI00168B625C|nr:AAA family ATPase [Treponema zioleckii]